MSKYFSINGYWKDDLTNFDGYIVKEYDDMIEGEDEDVFYFGLSESDIQASIQSKGDDILEFVITSYEPINL